MGEEFTSATYNGMIRGESGSTSSQSLSPQPALKGSRGSYLEEKKNSLVKWTSQEGRHGFDQLFRVIGGMAKRGHMAFM